MEKELYKLLLVSSTHKLLQMENKNWRKKRKNIYRDQVSLDQEEDLIILKRALMIRLNYLSIIITILVHSSKILAPPRVVEAESLKLEYSWEIQVNLN
jgi:hypothetical protein